MWTDIFIIAAVVLSGLANLFLAAYVYSKNPKEKVNKFFFYFGFTIFLWCLTNFISLLVKDIFWIRATYSVSTTIVLSGIFFAYAFSDKVINRLFKIFLSVASILIFIACVTTPFLIESITSYTNFGYVATPGILFPIFGAYLVIFSAMIIGLPLSVLNKVDGERKNQILYYLTGVAIFACWCIFVDIVLPLLGYSNFINLDTPASIFIVGFTSYSIIRYHLMGISSLFFQAFVYSLVIISIIALLLLLMFVGSYLFAHTMLWPVYIVAIIISIVLFYIGRLFFVEKRDLEKAKINLTNLLDQSEKNRIEIQTERDKTATIINSFADGLIILDEKNEIYSVNPEAEKILGLKSSEVLKKPIISLNNFPKALPVAQVLNIGLLNFFKREISMAKDFTIELSVIPLNLNKNDIGHLIVLHNISSEKMVDKMRTEFVSLVAHQLRTPLTAVNWSMGMLKNGEFGKLSKKQSEVIESTLHNNDRLISLVNNILNITRIEGGKYLYETAMTDMREVVNSVIDSYDPEIRKRKIKIEFREPEYISQVMMDVEKMKIVVQNLIDNAIKYSHEAGKIIITLKSDDKNIIFNIQDVGIGIPKGQQENIFTKFFRSDNAVRVDPNGTGLGLYLTKNIINAHGGEIWFESEEDHGSSIYFSLPLKKKE